MTTTAVAIEIVFFAIGMVPWWCACAMRNKTKLYWCILLWVCCVMLVYYAMHRAPVGVVNNVVEMSIGVYGLRRISAKAVAKSGGSRT